MADEHEYEFQEWEEPPSEEIPPGLQKKWDRDEKRGVRAGVCSSCDYPFHENDLSCRHCGKAIEVESGTIGNMAHWFFKTPWGVVSCLILLLALLAFLL